MELEEEIREFLIESSENLASLDRELIQLEQNPRDLQLISSAFRTIHTIKGTCGFFGYDTLGAVTHVTENLLGQVREGQRELTPQLISLVLQAVDAVKALLASIESTGAEGEDTTGPLRARLEAAYHQSPDAKGANTSSAAAVVPPAQAAVQGAPEARRAGEREPLPGPAVQPQELFASPPPPLPAAGEVRLEVGRDATEPPRDASRDLQLADSTIRVDVALLDRLMNLVGELVLARNQLLQQASAHNPALQQTSQRLNLITGELQEGVMKTRMQPIGVVWNKLPRVVRDLAAQCGKRIQIEMEGSGTELDKTIIEAIKDPLTHIVRNSCDHGIEMPEARVARGKRAEGLLLLRAYHEGGVVNIEISDDGAGIDPARVKAKAVEKGLLSAEQAAGLPERDALHLIFRPGFSTAATITSISGRGVGMDVVKTNIEKIGGSVEVGNRAGRGTGTTIRIKIPLTLAIVPGLVVTLTRPAARNLRTAAEGGEPEGRYRRATDGVRPPAQEGDRFILPQASLVELVRVEPGDAGRRIEHVHGTPVFRHRDKLLPLVSLRSVLGLEGAAAESTPGALSRESVHVIVVQAEQRQMGLVVDSICDTQEIVVKPLGRQLQGLISYLGATIMGDGRPALILDVAGLARLAGLGAEPRQPALVSEEPDSHSASSAPPEMMLLFRASGYPRLAVPLALVDRLEEMAVDQMEHAAGRPVLHYRREILPLVTLHALLTRSAVHLPPAGARVQIIVLAEGSRRVGLIVDGILDIVHERITAVRSLGAPPGLLGSGLLGNEITDLLDLGALLAFTEESCREDGASPSNGKAVSHHLFGSRADSLPQAVNQ